jgi:hypothetical protein
MALKTLAMQKQIDILGGFTTDAPRTDAPATVTPEPLIKPRSKPKLSLCLALTYTYIVILIYVLTLTQTRAYTLNYSESKCCWGASVRGATIVLPFWAPDSAMTIMIAPSCSKDSHYWWLQRNDLLIRLSLSSHSFFCCVLQDE